MRKKIGLVGGMIVLIIGLVYSFPALGEVGIGLGTHYNVALKEIDISNFDNSHLSYVASLRTKTAWIMLDGGLEYRPNLGDISYTVSPRISFLVDILGSGIYGGAGVQKTYIQWTSGTSEWSNLTYLLQAGWEVRLGAISLTLDAQYESPIFSVQDINTDFVTFGARVFIYF